MMMTEQPLPLDSANGQAAGTATSRPALSPYEAARVREIAAWKSTRVSRLAEVIDTLTTPVTWR
jgi:hypothetical protein